MAKTGSVHFGGNSNLCSSMHADGGNSKNNLKPICTNCSYNDYRHGTKEAGPAL